MGSWEQSDLLPFPVQIPHSLAERAPRKAALSQVNHTQSVLHSLIASFPITYSLCAFTAAQPSPLRPWQLGVSLAIISLQLLKASENDPKRPPFSVRAKGSQWNHRGNTIFSVSTLAHGISCHKVIPGQTVWQPLGVCSAQLSTHQRQRKKQEQMSPTGWVLPFLFLFWGYSVGEVSRKWTARKKMQWSLGNQRYKVRTYFSDYPSRMCLQRGVCTVSLQSRCIKVFKHSIKHHPKPQYFCKASRWS